MFYPEVPLLHAMLVLALVVGFQRLLARLVVRSEGVETFVEGTSVELVRDGVMIPGSLHRAGRSREDLFERLRAQGVRQLGEVQRAHFEQDGNLTMFSHAGDVLPGLAVVPPWDLEPPRPIRAGTRHPGVVACLTCGTRTQTPGRLPVCPRCGGDTWTAATTDPLAPPGGSDRDPPRDGGQSPDRGQGVRAARLPSP